MFLLCNRPKRISKLEGGATLDRDRRPIGLNFMVISMISSTGSFPENDDVTYKFDEAASNFTVQAFAAGVMAAFGHNPVIRMTKLSGDLTISANDPEQASFSLEIDPVALTVVSDMPEKDRREIERIMHEEVLEDGQFPAIVYECSRISASRTGEGLYWAALNGELTLHGIRRKQTIATQVRIRENLLKASGSFSLRQSDHGIKLVSVAAGALRVKDELKFSFDISAEKSAQN